MAGSRLAEAVLLLAAGWAVAGQAHAVEPLVVGILPYLAAGELHRRFEPLAGYLSARLGRPVTVDVATNYDATLDAVGAGDVDIGFVGPAPYVRLVERFGPKRLLARLEVAGSPTFHGYIVTREESPLTRLADLAGHSFAFGDPQSTMSHLVPRAMLAQAWVPVNRLSRYLFVDNHDNVALGVLAGAFDAGAVMAEVYETYRGRGLRALAKSPPISELLFVAADHLPDATVAAVRESLLALDIPAILNRIKEGTTRLVPVSDADYDPMRELLRRLQEEGGDRPRRAVTNITER